ncbi:hypothetical protein A7U60_g5713 [Sanghuangporus baumii]|uniref:Uncharacterized protein n=1 Tax=Sanghuangporus baumii TaxID=108892 RepID=A0A9Q5N367_SANBA|nr:hypothetical protein A7U60_g5713 [Sanghuangporus baumii]
MASDPPQLDLNDILLNIDGSLSSQPGNGPLDASVAAVTDASEVLRSMSPEPPDEQELLAMRLRALSIRDSKGKEREDSPGNELIEMVLRLTAAVPARAQLLEQAAVIRRLSVQLDFLLTRMNDDRARWEAEKNCMQRVCEALILQANFASHNVYKDQDGAKKPAILEAENTSLRQKLAITQSKVNSLEAELAQLRPLLLMQPSAIASSKGLALTPGKSGKKEEDGAVENVEGRSYYRAREEKATATSSPKSKKKKATAYFKHAPTVADARSEHLLLAMRKLGKERATMLSQSMYRTTEPPYPPGTTPNQDLTMHIKNNGNQPRPMMSPAVWPAHLQQAAPTGQQSHQSKPQQGQLVGSPAPAKGQQNPPFSQYGPPAGAHFQHYFVPSSSVPRPPGAPMPPPAFYHAGPPRGYIPGPAWPYYAPGPYAFGQPIPVQNPSQGTNVSSTQPRPANSPPVAGPSRAPVPSASQSNSAPSSTQGTSNANQANMKSPRQGQQARGPRTPQSKSTSTPTNRNTPMDNLLSAAQSVFSPSAPPASGRDATPVNIGSPSPKKRKRVDQQDGQAKSQSKGKQPVGNVDRRTSALDVLADQAAGVDPSAQSPGSGSANRGVESASPSSVSGSRQSADSGDVFIVGSSKASGGPSTNESMRRASSVRKGKRRTARASSTTPTSTVPPSSLAPPITTQRAASEDRAPSISSASQLSTESFKLRPVQDETFPNKNGAAARSARSGSLPRNTGSPSNRGSSAAAHGRQPNGRALTPLGYHGSARLSRPASSRSADIDAGVEVESEDEPDVDADVDQLDDDDATSPRSSAAAVKKRAGISSAETGSPGEDVNSRRWLEILGRKES